MAGKKEPTSKDAIKYYDEIMVRASTSGYRFVNKIISAKSKNRSVLIIPDDKLWDDLIARNQGELKELDINNPEEANIKFIYQFAEDLKTGWIDIDPESFSKGKITKITYNNLGYDIPINKDLLPLKLRKVEWNNISYRIFISSNLVLGLKKRFDSALEGYGFTIMTLYKIL